MPATWPKNPTIYEINTWVWLGELSRRYGRRITLKGVPASEWDAIAAWSFDAVWLMGVWERSPLGISIALQSPLLWAEMRHILPDLRQEDIAGSPYCIRRYVVDEHLGGPEGLAIARQELDRRGMRLILDYVPNHVAPDHPWVSEHPDFFIQGKASDLARDPKAFLKVGDGIFARGRDPYFPPWSDVLQLNTFNPGLRQAAIETVSAIAAQCDGMRCDMVMLLMTDIFARTWGKHAGSRPTKEYWQELIPAVRLRHPGVIFIAEAYWDLEWALLQQGFDYCYDKRLYDRLEHETAEAVRLHLLAGLDYQEKLVRFIENHDEPRAAAELGPRKGRAAAVAITSLPGAKLFHEGQFEGNQVKLHVFLGRRPAEAPDLELQEFYRQLLQAVKAEVFRCGEWRLCEIHGWPDNPSYQKLAAWCWRKGENRYLITINLSDSTVYGLVSLPWDDLAGHTWHLQDLLNGEAFERDGGGMVKSGLFVGLEPWKYHFLHISEIS